MKALEPYGGQPLAHYRSYTPDTFGSAHYMTPMQAARDETLSTPSGGAFLGLLARNQMDPAVRLYANLPGHTLTCAPTGAGKGVNLMLPNLLSLYASTLVLDIKGENFEITAAFRHNLGRVLRFAPWGRGGLRWNPLDEITEARGAAEAEEVARFLTELLIETSGQESDPYWNNAAKGLMITFLLHVALAPLAEFRNGPGVTERTMAEVVRLSKLEPALFEELLDHMAQSPSRLVRENVGMIRMIYQAKEQFSGVMGNLLAQVEIWGMERIAAATARSDFAFEELRTPGTTLYLCVPPEFIPQYRAVLRTLIGCAMRRLKNSADKSHPVLFMLDEFPALGRIKPIVDNLAYLRGYGIRFWFFIQNLKQLERIYGEACDDFLANAAYQNYFGVSDLTTAQMISERIGSATVQNIGFNENYGLSESTTHSSGSGWSGGTHSSNSSTSRTSGTSHGYGRNLGYVGRRLITPEEVLCLHPLEQLLFVRGKSPIRAAMLPYYKHPILNARAGQWSGQDQV